MKLVKKLNNKQLIHYSLVVLLLTILGFILSLVFYFIFRYDVFYLYDKDIIIQLNNDYKINVITDKYSNNEMKWISNNPDVVSVSKDGILRANNMGETEIHIKSKFKLFNRKIKVTVSDFKITNIAVDEHNIELYPGEEYKINTIVNNDIDIRTNLYYSSSDENIAVVNEDGMIRALSEGPCTIKISSSDTKINTTVHLNVIPKNDVVTVMMPDNSDEENESEDIVDIEQILVNANKINMYTGDTKKISTIVLPINASNKDITFTSSDNKIATVNQSGYVKAINPGICNIFINSPGKNISASVVIKVDKKISLEFIDYSVEEIDLDIGEKYLLIPVIKPDNTSIRDVYYLSSNSKVATVDSYGKITGKSRGNTTIIAITKDGFISNTIKINVSNDKVENSNIENVVIDNFKPIMIAGKSNKIEISNKNNSKLNLTISSPDVATITQDGLISAKKAGIVYLDIESIDGRYHNKKMISILPGEVYAELITLNKYATQIKINDTFLLEASVIPENAINKKIIWESNDESIATVDGNGRITGHNIGTAVITARVSNSGISRSSRVSVVSTDKIIDIKNKELSPYYNNFKIYEKDGSAVRTMQNFAIGNYGKDNEFIYVSYPFISHVSKLSSYNKKGLVQTNIVKIYRKDINSPRSKNRKYMYVKNGGHGQSLDIDKDNNYIWVNGNSIITRDSDGVYWGGNLSNIKVKFTSNKVNSNIKVLNRFTVKKDNGTYYNNVEIAFDWDNDLAASRSGGNVFIYKASELLKGKKILLYQFYVPAKSIDGTNYYRQGIDINDGYYYQFRGIVSSKMLVEVYNFAGEYQYTYTFNPKFSKQEPEGLKIYDDKIYVGITSKCPGCVGRLNSIYYFK